VSAESYAHNQFTAALDNPAFSARIYDTGINDLDQVVIVDSSTPVGEVLARCGDTARLVAVCDEDAPHGFALARIEGTDQ
jgi:hypothetical protein